MSSNLLSASVKTSDASQAAVVGKSVGKSPDNQGLGEKIASDVRSVFKKAFGEANDTSGLESKIEEALKAESGAEQIENLKALIADESGNVSEEKLQELLAVMENKSGIDTAQLKQALTKPETDATQLKQALTKTTDSVPSVDEVLARGDKASDAFKEALAKGDKKALELKDAIASGDITAKALEKALDQIKVEQATETLVVKAPQAVEEVTVALPIESRSIGKTTLNPVAVDAKASGNAQADTAKNLLSESRIAKVDVSKFVDVKQPGSQSVDLKQVMEGKSDASTLQALMASKYGSKAGTAGQVGAQGALQAISGGQAGAEATSALSDGLTQLKASSAEWSPINLKPNQGQWGKELAAALGDRLTMQINQNVKEASVRLDPAELGRIDLSVKVEGDRLVVSMNSNNAQVRDLINQHIDRLRGELEGQNGQKLEVSVGEGGSDKNKGSGSSGDKGNAPGMLADGSEDETADQASASNNSQWLDTRA